MKSDKIKKKLAGESGFNISFFKIIDTIKLTEGRRLKLQVKGWGLLTDYYLESVKINRYKDVASTTAVLRIGDRSGQITCVVKGPTVALLFGLSVDDWLEVEKMCDRGQQLFYRYFKNGLSGNFRSEQKIFYHFCASNQKRDILTAVFCRCVNQRNKDKNDAFLHILELRNCNNQMLDMYIESLRQNVSKNLS